MLSSPPPPHPSPPPALLYVDQQQPLLLAFNPTHCALNHQLAFSLLQLSLLWIGIFAVVTAATGTAAVAAVSNSVFCRSRFFCQCHWHGVVVAAIATIAVAKIYASAAPFGIFFLLYTYRIYKIIEYLLKFTDDSSPVHGLDEAGAIPTKI